MRLERVGQPTVTFVAVSEETSDTWAALALGFCGALPVIVVMALLFRALAS